VLLPLIGSRSHAREASNMSYFNLRKSVLGAVEGGDLEHREPSLYLSISVRFEHSFTRRARAEELFEL